MGGWFALNGNGEMTGTAWLDESGFAEGPIGITNTHSVGVVRDALVAWLVKRDRRPIRWYMPIVAETYDGRLNDIDGMHVKPAHVFAALRNARGGPVAEGNVGGGTGMICHQFKGGIGTASRKLGRPDGGWTVGVLVQANYGLKRCLTIAGVPVGRELIAVEADMKAARDTGSIIILVATDAPLLPHQCKRLARRAGGMGLARLGSFAANSSGDIFLAFSTGNSGAARAQAKRVKLDMLPNAALDPLFEATVQATEESILNALVAARDMQGINAFRVRALPHEQVRAILRKYNRLCSTSL